MNHIDESILKIPSVPASGVDEDPVETQEWLDALESVVSAAGTERGNFLMQQLEKRAARLGLKRRNNGTTPYCNSISLAQQPRYPGDAGMEVRITSIIRWNALAMVVRANKAYGELGGHIASYASAAEIFELGFNHFFRASGAQGADTPGDLVFFQPHSAPGVYARAFLEGRLQESQLANYRQEVAGKGLSSYPHPWLMPDFWQFPTGSMGLGPISAIYQAHFMRYLRDRDILDTRGRRVWGVFGDGEMDEPESIAGLTLAAREKLDNLTFIINCNLQRLDGPVRGNGQIIQELEALFSGAGWNVIKVVWGSEWDDLFARDVNGILLRRFAETVDGQYQTLGANGGAYNLAHFFDADPELKQLVAHLSDAQIDQLKRGGHDFLKLHAAFDAAQRHEGRPTVILAKTKKGFGMGGIGESRMTSHQQKKLDVSVLRAFRDRFDLPLSDDDVEQMRFYKPAPDSAEMRYLKKRREALGGYMPARRRLADPLTVPSLDKHGQFAIQADGKEMSTTMAAVRLLSGWLKEPGFGSKIVPIVADEARTFGMANLFRQIGIYSPSGQLYEPEDASSLLYYKEARNGQLLEEGISEAGAVSSWIAAATSYSVHGVTMLPFYIYYSMFGFQRIGDLIWAAADQRARGFLLGATAGRTTLGGEGLQHQDGSSHIVAATIPNCRAYDPAFAGELALIMDHGARQMVEKQEDVFYYLTLANENYANPSLPEGAREAVIKGMYCFATYDVADAAPGLRVRLLGAGPILLEMIAAAQMLQEEWGIASEVWSVTSFSELAREAREVERWNRRHPEAPQREAYLQTCLPGDVPVVAASDYVRACPQMLESYLQAPFTAMGTDGFGRSDTRRALRRFFEVDRENAVLASMQALADKGLIPRKRLGDVISRYSLDVSEVTDTPPWGR